MEKETWRADRYAVHKWMYENLTHADLINLADMLEIPLQGSDGTDEYEIFVKVAWKNAGYWKSLVEKVELLRLLNDRLRDADLKNLLKYFKVQLLKHDKPSMIFNLLLEVADQGRMGELIAWIEKNRPETKRA